MRPTSRRYWRHDMTDNVRAFLRLYARLLRRADGLPELPDDDVHIR